MEMNSFMLAIWHRPMFALLFGGDADMFEGYWLKVNRTLLISESVSFILCLDFLLKEIVFSTFCSWYLVMASTGPCHKEVPLISLPERTSKSVSCKKGKEPRGHSIQGGSSKNLQGGSLTNPQGRSLKEAPFVSILFQSLEDTSVAAWEKLKSKWIFAARTKKMIWTDGRMQQNSKSGKLHNLNGQQWKIWRISWQLAMEQLHHWMQPFFSTTTIWFWPGWIWTVWIVLENFLRRWIWFSILVQMIVVSSGKHGHEKKMFWSSIKSGNLMEKINLRTAAVLFALFARIRSTVWTIFWDWNSVVQCVKNHVSFMLFLLELVNLLVLCWQVWCFLDTVT